VRYLGLSKDGARLCLVIPDQLPLRSAAHAIPGCHPEGVQDGSACFSYPASPDAARALVDTFTPDDVDGVDALLERHAALSEALLAKEGPSELAVDVCLRTVPMDHQVQAINFMAARIAAGAAGGALLMEQGTGKSLVAIALANWLHARGLIRWVYVLAPNSLKGTWGADDGEVLLHSRHQAQPTILRGTRDKRQEHLHRVLQRGDSPTLPWLITNYEEHAVSIRKRDTRDAERFQGTLDIIRQAGPGLLVCDESSMLKSETAQRTITASALAKLFPYRLLLTGTPVEAGPLDVFSQFQVFEPGCLGFNTRLAFERQYAVYQRRKVFVRGGAGRQRIVNKVVSYAHLDDLRDRVGRLSFRARASECLDLPPVVTRKVPVELSTEQARLLRSLKEDLVAEHKSGRYVDGRNVLTRYQKMSQVLGGWVRTMDADGKPTGWEDVGGNAKLSALEEYLGLAMEDPERKVVVFAEHPETELAGIAAMCERKGWGPVLFHGKVSEKERDARRQRFNTDPDCRVFVAQWACAAKGLNLTAADTIVFYTPTWKYGDWAQARKRVHRKGQLKTVTEVYLLGVAPRKRGGKPTKTLDHVMLEALSTKHDVADIVTGDRAARILEAI